MQVASPATVALQLTHTHQLETLRRHRSQSQPAAAYENSTWLYLISQFGSKGFSSSRKLIAKCGL